MATENSKKYRNKSQGVIRFSEGGQDYVVGPGRSFTALSTPYTEGLVAAGLTAVVDNTPNGPATPAAGSVKTPAAPATKTVTPATTALPEVPTPGRSE